MVAAATERATCDGQLENITAKIDSFKNFVDNIYITILLNQYIRYFSSICFKLQLATCSLYKLSVTLTTSAVSEVAVLHRRYAVFLPVFAVRVIKI